MSMRLAAPLFVVLALGHAAIGQAPASMSRCEPQVPAGAKDVRTLGNRLAGKYELRLMPTQAADAKPRIYWLYLTLAEDAAARRKSGYDPAVRLLHGWAVATGADSTDSKRMAANLAEHLLIIGPGAVPRSPDRIPVDGPGDLEFRLTAVARDGFWGWWVDKPGILIRHDGAPYDAGYFCARRLS